MTGDDVRWIIRAAMAGQARELEQTLAIIVKRLRDERVAELEQLRQRIGAVEKDLAVGARLDAIERRLAGAEDGGGPAFNVAHLRKVAG